MFKDDNIFRDFLFALALIALIRLMYQQRAEQVLPKALPQLAIIQQEESSFDRLLKKTEVSLQQVIVKAQTNNNAPLQQEVEILKQRWSDINRQYHQKIKQEDAMTCLLGPLYTASKVAKEHVLNKKLNLIHEDIVQVLRQADIPQGKTSAYIAAVQV